MQSTNRKGLKLSFQLVRRPGYSYFCHDGKKMTDGEQFIVNSGSPGRSAHAKTELVGGWTGRGATWTDPLRRPADRTWVPEDSQAVVLGKERMLASVLVKL